MNNHIAVSFQGRRGLAAIAIASAACVTSTSFADTLLVPSQYPTIQAAIDAAVPGDQVVVADGTYTGDGNRDIDFLGKAITVRSENGAKACVLDCNGSEYQNHRGFFFHSGEGPGAIVDGFTITNGFVGHYAGGYESGGGIRCQDSSPTIRNCVISNCSATGHRGEPSGGGIAVLSGGPTISDCVISGCWVSAQSLAPLKRGGGAYIGGNAVVLRCTFVGNSFANQQGLGGGIWIEDDAILAESSVLANEAFLGGGIFAQTENVVIRDCIISGNSSAAFGGFVIGGNVVLQGCCVVENTGGGGRCFGASRIENCILAGNTGAIGGGVRCTSGTPCIINSTITGNSATAVGGGVAAASSSALDIDVSLINCVVVDNDAADGDQCAIVSEAMATSMTLSYSNVESAGNAVSVVGELSKLLWGPGNIDADPLFVDPDGPDDDPLTYEDNDYRLMSGSPCIDAGDNLSVSPETKIDLAGEPRFRDDPCTVDIGNPDGINPIVDMGPYEFQGSTCDLDADGDIDADDLAGLLAQWGLCEPDVACIADLDGDGDVGPADLAQLIANWT